jgi:hypothetical protein
VTITAVGIADQEYHLRSDGVGGWIARFSARFQPQQTVAGNFADITGAPLAWIDALLGGLATPLTRRPLIDVAFPAVAAQAMPSMTQIETALLGWLTATAAALDGALVGQTVSGPSMAPSA